MTWTQSVNGEGIPVYLNSDTGEQSNDPSGMQQEIAAQQSLTPENLKSAFKSTFGTDAPDSWMQQVQNLYGNDPNNNIDVVMRDAATAAANSNTPFSNKQGDQSGFTGGAQYYQSQGYVPGGTSLEGVPTSFVDPKTGKVVASYGTISKGTDPNTSIRSGNWTWNDASSTPAGYVTDLAKAKTDDYNLQHGLIAGALLAAAVATGGALAPELIGAEGAIGAGALGGAEAFPVLGGAAIPGTELGAVGTGALGAGGAGAGIGLTDAEAAALMENNLLPANMQIPASQGLTATEALRYANLAKSGISALTNATSSPNLGISSLTGPALMAAMAALAAKSRNSSGSPSDTQPVNPVTFNWNYQAPDETDKYIARGQKILSPQYTTATMAQGGVTMLNHNQRFASGGISDLGGYSDGGRMLKGPGDGMSDSIPASIENKRPARLATDEFVVPADVVSHLGNGSSEAGAKVLYAMMDKVRKARTGNTKQGKQINPSNFMPG